jgi:hypothetical protein
MVAPILFLLLQLVPSQATTADIDSMSQQVCAAQKMCGPVAVYYCLQRLGYEIELSRVIDSAMLEEQGMSLTALLDLIHACEPSLKPRGTSVNPNYFGCLPIPSILILDGHCVVYDGYRPTDHMTVVFDPARNRILNVSESELKHA